MKSKKTAVFFLVLIIGIFGFLYYQYNPSNTISSCDTSLAKRCVTYKVFSDAKIFAADFLDREGYHRASLQTSSWQTSESLNSGDSTYVTGTKFFSSGPIVCEIWVDGVLLIQKSESNHSMVICDAVIP